MFNGNPLEMFLGLMCFSSRWQAMTGAESPMDARGFIKTFGESGDAEITDGRAVAFAKVSRETMELSGAPSSYNVNGRFLLAVECPQTGPEGTYGATLAAARDFKDGHMAVWEDLRMLRYDILTTANVAGSFHVRSIEMEEATRAFYSRPVDRWRFHITVEWGPDT